MSTYRWAIRAYPALYRREHGEELVATAIEMTESRWSVRQSASFVVEGLTMRAEDSAGWSRPQAWAKGMSLGITIWFLYTAAFVVSGWLLSFGWLSSAYQGDDFEFIGSPWLRHVWMAVMVAMALVFVVSTGRRAAMFITLGFGAWVLALVSHPAWSDSYSPVVMASLVAAAVWFVALYGDGCPAIGFRFGMGFVVVTAAIAVVDFEFVYLLISLMMMFGLPVVGLLLLWIDPRPFVAGLTIWVITSSLKLVSLWSEGWDDSPTELWPLAVLAGVLAFAGGVGHWGVRRLVATPV